MIAMCNALDSNVSRLLPNFPNNYEEHFDIGILNLQGKEKSVQDVGSLRY